MKEGTFPKSVKLANGGRAVGWASDELEGRIPISSIAVF
jgi:predicted DNA-binding transcriptional regulator AlpA